MRAESLPLVVGLPGHQLSASERRVVDRIRPPGFILFARNVESTDQVRRLTEELRELDPRPFICVDLEGGKVNRLEALWGPLPSPAAAAAAGRRAIRALGEAAGAACRSLGIHLDLAPVVDLERDGAVMTAEGRCLGGDPERVVTLARVFREGLATWGVGGCLKHFPGLGEVPVDTHEALAVVEVDDHDPHLEVFAELAAELPLVMVGHVVAPGLGDGERPASLSRRVVARAAELPGSPVVLSDDLEMGALAAEGDLPQRVVAALRARNHGVLVCKAFDRLEDIAGALEKAIDEDPIFESRINELAARLVTLGRDLCLTADAVPAPDDETVAQLWEQARQEAAG